MIDEATGYKLCKRGHVKSPDNVYQTSTSSTCRECQRILNNPALRKTSRSKWQKASDKFFSDYLLSDIGRHHRRSFYETNRRSIQNKDIRKTCEFIEFRKQYKLDQKRLYNKLPHVKNYLNAYQRHYSTTQNGLERAKKRQSTERYIIFHRKYANDQTLKISDSYIASCMAMPVSEIPTEILTLKRAIIKLRRSIKNGKK